MWTKLVSIDIVHHQLSKIHVHTHERYMSIQIKDTYPNFSKIHVHTNKRYMSIEMKDT
jgi:hypothetical protein